MKFYQLNPQFGDMIIADGATQPVHFAGVYITPDGPKVLARNLNTISLHEIIDDGGWSHWDILGDAHAPIPDQLPSPKAQPVKLEGEQPVKLKGAQVDMTLGELAGLCPPPQAVAQQEELSE